MIKNHSAFITKNNTWMHTCHQPTNPKDRMHQGTPSSSAERARTPLPTSRHLGAVLAWDGSTHEEIECSFGKKTFERFSFLFRFEKVSGKHTATCGSNHSVCTSPIMGSSQDPSNSIESPGFSLCSWPGVGWPHGEPGGRTMGEGFFSVGHHRIHPPNRFQSQFLEEKIVFLHVLTYCNCLVCETNSSLILSVIFQMGPNGPASMNQFQFGSVFPAQNTKPPASETNKPILRLAATKPAGWLRKMFCFSTVNSHQNFWTHIRTHCVRFWRCMFDNLILEISTNQKTPSHVSNCAQETPPNTVAPARSGGNGTL